MTNANTCSHVPPSPGQSMCACEAQRIELQYALHAVERSHAEKARGTIIPLPWPKPPLTGNRTRGNPYAQAVKTKAAIEGAQAAIRAAKPKPMGGANVVLHFRPKDRRRRDADGMFPTLKACIDALVISGVLHDDSWVEVPSATCCIHPPNGEPAAMWLQLVDPDEGAA